MSASASFPILKLASSAARLVASCGIEPQDVVDLLPFECPEAAMEALLTAIVVWLSTSFGVPATFDHPRVDFVSAAKMTSLFYESIGHEQAGMSSNQPEATIVSLYNRQTRTIYLLDGWTGKTPADLSVLVHEMVHHLQNVGGLTFACPQEREELAYKAQDRWLGLFGHDLAQDFQLDGFSILVKTKCL